MYYIKDDKKRVLQEMCKLLDERVRITGFASQIITKVQIQIEHVYNNTVTQKVLKQTFYCVGSHLTEMILVFSI